MEILTTVDCKFVKSWVKFRQVVRVRYYHKMNRALKPAIRADINSNEMLNWDLEFISILSYC